MIAHLANLAHAALISFLHLKTSVSWLFFANGGATSKPICDDRCKMIENQKFRPAQVIGPLGEPLTLETLPPPTTTRWVIRRKGEVVAAVNGGLLTIDEACDRYQLTLEEFASWQRAVDRSGLPGLRVTRVQHEGIAWEVRQATLRTNNTGTACKGITCGGR